MEGREPEKGLVRPAAARVTGPRAPRRAGRLGRPPAQVRCGRGYLYASRHPLRLLLGVDSSDYPTSVGVGSAKMQPPRVDEASKTKWGLWGAARASEGSWGLKGEVGPRGRWNLRGEMGPQKGGGASGGGGASEGEVGSQRGGGASERRWDLLGEVGSLSGEVGLLEVSGAPMARGSPSHLVTGSPQLPPCSGFTKPFCIQPFLHKLPLDVPCTQGSLLSGGPFCPQCPGPFWPECLPLPNSCPVRAEASAPPPILFPVHAQLGARGCSLHREAHPVPSAATPGP